MRKFIGFLILTFCMLALLCVVASAETTVDLLAGQDIVAGSVTVSYDGDELCVTYDTGDDWQLVETHFTIAEILEDIPQTKKGNPKVGHFLYGDDELGVYDDGNLIGGVDSDGECIELELEVGTYIIAAQANLLNIVDTDPDDNLLLYTETGWGEGDEFADDRNWAMYFTFTVE